MPATVVSVHLSPTHSFSKPSALQIRLLEGRGVEGDAHCGESVQHRSRSDKRPPAPNLRQVHLMPAELFDELATQGFRVEPGELGENITTRGIDLLALPEGTALHIGAAAVVTLTGLRTPCAQIEAFQSGLQRAVLDRTQPGRPRPKAGVLGVVAAGGSVAPDDTIVIVLPAKPHVAMRPI